MDAQEEPITEPDAPPPDLVLRAGGGSALVILAIGVLLALLFASAAEAAGPCATIDTAGQAGGSLVFHHVDNTWARGWWADKPTLPQNWAVTRMEGTLSEIADWWSLSDPRTNYEIAPDGSFRFKPSPLTKPELDEWAFKAGLRPVIVLATSTIPAPLIQGGYRAGQYGYNVRQPTDYAKWEAYLESLLQWLVDQYGRSRVKTWTFMFGIESDWQARAVIPGTQTVMSPADNRREYMKMVDYFQAACEKVLGPTVYTGIYFAFVTQADDYLAHWAHGRNFATGRIGTRIAWCGFSDWTHVEREDKDPFSLRGYRWRQAHGWAETVPAWASGLVWKYDYLAARMAADGLPRAMEIGLPECGYFDDQGGRNAAGNKVPCDVLYADYRGAALRMMRVAAYAACPRLRWAWNRYALGTGDLSHVYADKAKPPMFDAVRIEKKLAGERMLPVHRTGATRDPSNDVRVLAAATDAPGVNYRIVAVSFNENFNAATPESLRLRLTGLGAARSARVTLYRIDADHNNWWAAWKRWREAHDLPYVAGANSGQFGSNILYGPKYAPWQADVIGTLRPEDVPKWLAKSAEFHAHDGLKPTSTRTVDIADSVATIDTTLQANSVLYLEVSGLPEHAVPVDGMALVRLSASGGGARLSRTLTGLTPNSPYTVTCRALASGRRMDYRMEAGPPVGPGRVEALGDWSARPNRLVVTTRSDDRGRLAISLSVPRQLCDPGDTVEFRDVRVVSP